jgi:hypothetical protein
VILLKVQWYPQLPVPTRQPRNSKEWIKPLPLESVDKTLHRDPTCIDSWRLIFQDLLMYL